jgi:hypothetical protein
VANLLKVSIRTEGPTAATAKDRRDALREAFAYLAGLWDKLFKMKRFGPGARNRYRLQPRAGDTGSGRKYKGSYTEAKALRRANGDGVRAVGETRPFVWSGATRSTVQSTHKIVAKAASAERGYAENIFDVPTLNLTPRKGTIKLREEFQRVTEEERKLLEGLGAQHYENNLRRVPPKTTRVA